MQIFEKLKETMPYKWRLQSKTKDGKKGNYVAYIDARDVMDRLDSVLGETNWKDEYIEVKGNLYCKLSLYIDGQWITKMDCGAESNIESEKGEASDAFKRAAVKFGIGRFLYDIPTKWIPLDELGRPTVNPNSDTPAQPKAAPAAKPVAQSKTDSGINLEMLAVPFGKQKSDDAKNLGFKSITINEEQAKQCGFEWSPDYDKPGKKYVLQAPDRDTMNLLVDQSTFKAISGYRISKLYPVKIEELDNSNDLPEVSDDDINVEMPF